MLRMRDAGVGARPNSARPASRFSATATAASATIYVLCYGGHTLFTISLRSEVGAKPYALTERQVANARYPGLAKAWVKRRMMPGKWSIQDYLVLARSY